MLARSDAIETVAQHAMSVKVRSTGCRSREPLQQPLRLVPANCETSTRQPCCCLGATTAFSAHPSRAMRSRETTITTSMSAHGGQHTVMTREPAEGGAGTHRRACQACRFFPTRRILAFAAYFRPHRKVPELTRAHFLKCTVGFRAAVVVPKQMWCNGPYFSLETAYDQLRAVH
ncbi:hypothetical protein FHW37_12315 [Neorhizobium alkalisoli]|uniref:Uncharacterized protein n=1 Tax=Neorhizobium alkalisoli TaxID=528178 RepID=A0A561PVV4_9HYPH|nr:hypothetical protein FHW37_12315 [Neorhizobium alkalisoli]